MVHAKRPQPSKPAADPAPAVSEPPNGDARPHKGAGVRHPRPGRHGNRVSRHEIEVEDTDWLNPAPLRPDENGRR